LGKLIFQNEGLYQHVLRTNSTADHGGVVMNIVAGRLLRTIPLRVFLLGTLKPLSAGHRQLLQDKYDSQLGPGTVQASFDPPLLALGWPDARSTTDNDALETRENQPGLRRPGASHAGRGFYLRIGPPSSVVLDSPYVSDSDPLSHPEPIRLGLGSRGSLFVFRKIKSGSDPWAQWQGVLDARPLRGRRVGALLLLLAAALCAAARPRVWEATLATITRTPLLSSLHGALAAVTTQAQARTSGSIYPWALHIVARVAGALGRCTRLVIRLGAAVLALTSGFLLLTRGGIQD
jgi:hypothetical protein